MVNREKYHGFYGKLEKYLRLSKKDMDKVKLINLRSYVKNNLPEVFEEMMSQDRFKNWLADDISACLICDLKYEDEKVGFVAYDIADIKSVCLSKVYILEKYRGKNIFGDHMWEMNNFRFNRFDKDMNRDFILQIKEPNLYTIKSLIKSKFIIPILPTLYMGLFSFFNITLTKIDNRKSATIMTPFYSIEIGSPVGVFGDELIYSGLCFIDDEDFNMSVSRDEFLSNPKKVDSLKEAIKMLSNELGEIALKEVGDCSELYHRN